MLKSTFKTDAISKSNNFYIYSLRFPHPTVIEIK